MKSMLGSSGLIHTASAVPAAEKARQWNRLADGMERFHGHFRWEFDRLYNIASGGYLAEGLTLHQYLREAEQLSHHLDMHHRIEETYIFPLLAKRMPQFRDSGKSMGAHIIAHRKIHEGLDKYNNYIAEVKANPKIYDPEKIRDIMDTFADTLFKHLEDEVKDLNGESMQKHGFKLDEIRRFPI
ncbi:uncharacterized protein LOC62_04G005992 [Vanrija pseudolonga]|uniref:Hemerythrin-like domain-containing protein n=1 Tax=Vanrija pseudolonga TaxID=143232 RepID=A0AAF0Y9Q5_9TREE|nr:hypothetical protein LOC62_04G005992 [Vanrija pseudolonga]